MNRGDSMRAAQRRAGLTLRQLADLSGVTFSAISALERGARAGTIDTIELLADALGLSIDEYTGHRPDEGEDGET